MVVTPARLIDWANRIDGRLGPISGHDADALAAVLRSVGGGEVVRGKPTLTPAQCRWFDEVHQCVVRRGLQQNRQSLVEVFSDMHDSNLTEGEVAPLVRKRLLRWVWLEKPIRSPNGDDFWSKRTLIGHRRTVDLTDRAIDIFWPGVAK